MKYIFIIINWEIQYICTSNHIFVREVWDKFPECIFENFEIARWNKSNFKIFKNHEDYLSQILPELNMWLTVNCTKPANTLYWH